MNHIKKIRDLIIYALVILSCTDISLPCHILFYCTKFPVIILCHVVFLSASLLLSLLAISRTLSGMSVPFFFLCLLTHRCYALLTGDEASPNWSEEFTCNFCVLIYCGYHLISVCFVIATLRDTQRCVTVIMFMVSCWLWILRFFFFLFCSGWLGVLFPPLFARIIAFSSCGFGN